MKIGIIFYSQTGNTRMVAERVKNALIAEGHEVVIDAIEVQKTINEERAVSATATLTHIPNTDAYEGIIFAAPVQGFSLARIVPSYFEHVGSLENKKIAHYVLHHLPMFFGGKSAIRKLDRLIRSKGGVSLAHFDVRSADENKEVVIEAGVQQLCALFSQE